MDLGGHNRAGFNYVSWPPDFNDSVKANYMTFDNDTETDFLFKGLEAVAGHKLVIPNAVNNDCGEVMTQEAIEYGTRMESKYGFRKDKIAELYPKYRNPDHGSEPESNSRNNQEVLNYEYTRFLAGKQKYANDYGVNLAGDMVLDLKYPVTGLNFTDYDPEYTGQQQRNSGISGGFNSKKLGKITNSVGY